MKVLDINETTNKEHAFAAALDAKKQHQTYWPLFSKAKQKIAQDLQALCYSAYFESKTYITARDKFISVKVDKPRASAAWQYPKELAALHAYATKVGIEPIATKTSLIFRVMK